MSWQKLGVAGLTLVLAACGGNEDKSSHDGQVHAGNCEVPAPCGGDPTGEWQIQNSCIVEFIGVASCPGLLADGTALIQTGSMTYAADKTYSSTSDLAGTLKTTYPAACLQGLDCAGFQALAEATAPSGDSSLSCAGGDSGSCLCTTTVSTTGIMEHGSYTTNGHLLTQTRSAGSSLDIEYCRSGSSLSLVSRNISTGMPAQITTLTLR
jgi:hypothetical protein